MKHIIVKITSEEGGPDIGAVKLDKEMIDLIFRTSNEVKRLKKEFNPQTDMISLVNYGCKVFEQSALDEAEFNEEGESLTEARNDLEQNESNALIDKKGYDLLLESGFSMDADGVRLQVSENSFGWIGATGEINWETYQIPISILK